MSLCLPVRGQRSRIATTAANSSGGVGGSPGAPGPAAAVLKALQVARVVARPPAVERLPADAEMPAGQGDVVALAVAELEPLKSLPGCFGELHRRLGQAQEP